MDATPSITRRSFVEGAATLAAAAALDPLGRPVSPSLAPSQADPLGVRADFPVAERRAYLNSAYITPSPRAVAAAGKEFLDRKTTGPIPLGEMLARADQVRAQFARLIKADPGEIGFLFATSEGENVVANAIDWKPGDNVVIAALHYETEFVLYRHLAETRGIELRIAPERDGATTVTEFEPLVDRKTRLVSLPWVSHQNGYRHDLRPIADLAHAHGAWCYTDAIQAVGMFPTDVKSAGVDFLCAGTYKWLLGGFGVAPFYVKAELLDRVRLDRFGALHVERESPDGRFELYRTAKRFDYATLPFAEVWQLGAGLAYLERVGVDRIEGHAIPLARRLYTELANQGKRLFTPPDNHSSIVTFSFTGDPASIKQGFDRAGIDVTVRDQQRQIRVSTALFNTATDVDRFLAAAKPVR